MQPYASAKTDKPKVPEDDDDEIIYILQLPDWECKCPVHNETIKTPRLDINQVNYWFIYN